MSFLDKLKDLVTLVVGLFVTVFAGIFAFRVTAKPKVIQKESDGEKAINSVVYDITKRDQAKQRTDEKVADVTKQVNDQVDKIKTKPVEEIVGLDDTSWNSNVRTGGSKR